MTASPFLPEADLVRDHRLLLGDLALLAAHEALGREDGVAGVGDRLALGRGADEALAGLGERDDGRRGARALGVRDDGGLGALEDSHAAVRGAEVDADGPAAREARPEPAAPRRTYARKGTVSELHVAAGDVRARVRGSRPQPYKVTITMRTFTDGEWDTLLGVVGTQLGHAAALLDGELPGALAEQAREAGADLLPGPGDLRPRCSCPDSANPCKHVAAVYYLVADEVDRDPFTLFLLRGRPRSDVLAELRARRAPARGERPKLPKRVDEGLTPRAAYARGRARSRLCHRPRGWPGRRRSWTSTRRRARAGRRPRCPASRRTRHPWRATC